MTIARDFVDWGWALDTEQVPTAVRSRAALHLLDGLGVAVAARRLDASPYASEVAHSLGIGREASMIGEARALSAPGAALANGLLVHALDFDDTHTYGLVHTTAVTIPAALAVAEEIGATGRDFLQAVVLGYELVARLGSAAQHGFHARGFHATSVCGAISSALVAARLYELTPEQAVNALGIAGSFASGSLEFLATGASTKQLHPGWASMAGIMAARLARAGATGPETFIEGGYGLYALFSDKKPSIEVVTAGLGDDWQVAGIEMKPYPACHLMHRALTAAAMVPRTPPLDAIEEIRLQLPSDSIPIVAVPEADKQRPRSPYEAKFSVQWSLAAIMIDGHIDVDTYLPGQLLRTDLRELAGRVHVGVATVEGPAAEAPVRVVVRLRDGVELVGDSGASDTTAGDLGDRIRTKFAANCSSEHAPRIVEKLASIEAEPDVRGLMILLAETAASWNTAADGAAR